MSESEARSATPRTVYPCSIDAEHAEHADEPCDSSPGSARQTAVTGE